MVSHVKEVHFEGGEEDYNLPPQPLNPEDCAIRQSTMKRGLKVKSLESLEGKGDREVKLGAKKLKPVPATELAKLKLKPVSLEEIQRLIQKDQLVNKNDSTHHDKGETTDERYRKRDFEATEETHEGLYLGHQESKVRKTDKPHQCKECPYKAALKGNLQWHVIAVHEKAKKYRCQQCPYKAARFCDLQQHMSAPHKKDPNDTSFIFDFVRLNSIERLRGPAPKASDNKRLRLRPVSANELAKLKLKPVSANDMGRHLQKDKQEFIEHKKEYKHTKLEQKMISTREKHINELLVKHSSKTDRWSQKKSLKDGNEQHLMTRPIQDYAEDLEFSESVFRHEEEPAKSKRGMTDSRENACKKEYEESVVEQNNDDSGAIESVLDAERLTFMKEEVEDLPSEQSGAKMKLRCNACGFKAEEMVEMTGHLISKHVDEL